MHKISQRRIQVQDHNITTGMRNQLFQKNYVEKFHDHSTFGGVANTSAAKLQTVGWLRLEQSVKFHKFNKPKVFSTSGTLLDPNSSVIVPSKGGLLDVTRHPMSVYVLTKKKQEVMVSYLRSSHVSLSGAFLKFTLPGGFESMKSKSICMI